ncbi:hypothetical protein IWW39_001872 [Coemansia spiralis]|uniref:Chitin-binding type-4 domain-containing protein n=1 Tax=Coemansia spiralis TaxID=417178 RepID=A0A9W8GM12_9FUNG|nr:hypothetical protein IWW39_001872 [Coemansia spiralis]
MQRIVRVFVSALLASTALAHVSMKSPCVRYTPFCDSCPELPPGQSLDNNINAPIGTHESVTQPLCKYTTPYAKAAAHWTAGSTVSVEFNPHAAVHGGGHAEFSLSYDMGKTFVVIHRELRYCFTGGPSSSNTGTQLSYAIPLPADLPSGDRVIFAWTWINAIGNREFYMNCADVAISGKDGGSFSGPQMLVANYGPDTPLIPEFNGNYETGIDLYNSRPVITVTGTSYNNGSAPAVPHGAYGAGSPSTPIATQNPMATIPVSSAPSAPYSTAPTPTAAGYSGGNPLPSHESLTVPATGGSYRSHAISAGSARYRARIAGKYKATRCMHR